MIENYLCYSVIGFLLFQSIEDLVNKKLKWIYFLSLLPLILIKISIGINRIATPSSSWSDVFYDGGFVILLIMVGILFKGFLGEGDILILIMLILFWGYEFMVLCMVMSLILVILIGGSYALIMKKSRTFVIPYIPLLTISVLIVMVSR